MAYIAYREGHLYAENVPLEKIAQQVQTPVYCYSASALRHDYQSYIRHCKPEDSLVSYAVKANTNQAIIGSLAQMGSGADVVSEGELRRALQAGIPAEKIVFSGVAKTSQEMRFALQQDIFQFNVESEPELELLNEVALSLGKTAPVSFRINPDIDARTHAKMSTGRASNKFGIAWSSIPTAYARAAELPGIKVQGIDLHIGSQLTELTPFEQAFNCMAELTGVLRAQGHEISVLDIGGGLGISYDDDGPQPPELADYAALATDILGGLGCRILVEPGRSMVGDTGILLSEVIYVKQGEHDEFLIIDAGMNDLLRPSMYDAYHEILAVEPATGEHRAYQIVGPICETGDTFAHNRQLPPLQSGDLVAIMNAGAYCAVMSSTYNARPLAPEVLIDDDRFIVIRKRHDYDEIIGLDTALTAEFMDE